MDPNAPYDPNMMPQGGYGDQPMAGNGDDGYWPPAPETTMRGDIQQASPQEAPYPVNAPGPQGNASGGYDDTYRPMPPGDVGGEPIQQPAQQPQRRQGGSTTLLDIIMGNSQ
jgi:penicillin-binding protein 1A